MKKNLSLFLLFLCFFFSSEAQQQADYEVFKFRNLGPNRGGRSTAVAGVAQRPGEFYMGTTGGGLWKTTDYGHSWNPVSDGFFTTGSIGAIRVADSNPDLVYCATGSDGIRSNVIAGDGVYKSEDAGKTWVNVGLKETKHIGAVLIDPKNENIAYIAAIGDAFSKSKERGVYKTIDGGKNWDKVLYLNDSLGVVDLEFHPNDPNTIYAAAWQVNRKPWTIESGPTGGIYKTTDAGKTWTKLTGGLPSGVVGKADLAVSPQKPDGLYVLIEALNGEGLYKSVDAGNSFEKVSDYKPLLDRPFYYCNVDANPENFETVFVNSTQFWRSYNGGKNWSRLRTPHGDNHDMWFLPSDTSVFIQSNDGGSNITRDYGMNWSTQTNQSTAELYQVEVDDQYPYWVYAGQQDNSTIAIPNAPPYPAPGGDQSYWMSVGGCETGPAVPKPGDPDIVYSNCKGRFGVYNKRTGQEKQFYVGASYMYGHNPKELPYRFQRVAPIHVSPHDPNIVYHGSQYLHKSTNDGQTWETISPDLTAFEKDKQVISGSPITRDVTGEEFYSTLYSIRESPVKQGQIWTGANDGPVYVTQNNGGSWEDVTPSNIDKGGRVDAVEPSHFDPNHAYISVLRYQLGDWKPYALKTEDGGKSWKLLSDGNNGIPANYPVRVVREHPNKQGVLFAGTEYGLFVSINDGKDWQSMQQNLPITPITDIKLHRGDLVMSTMGRGFWIMDNVDLYISTLMDKDNSEVMLLPAEVTDLNFRSWGNSIPQYPSSGVDVFYFLQSESPVVLEILNSDGKLIDAYVSKATTKEDEPQVSMATGFTSGISKTGLSSKTGWNHFEWDKSHFGSWDSRASRNGARGPEVSPGTYSLRLMVDGEEVAKKSVNLLIDPRLPENGTSVEDLQKQESLSLEIRDLLSIAKAMEHLVEQQLESKDKISKKRKAQLQALQNKLTTAEGRYMKPMLVAQISYLYSMITSTDQIPGNDAYERHQELKKQTLNLMDEYKKELKGLDEVIKINLK